MEEATVTCRSLSPFLRRRTRGCSLGPLRRTQLRQDLFRTDEKMKNRRASKRNRFCWSRVVLDGCVTYRLFRRDYTGRVHPKKVEIVQPISRGQRAELGNQAHHALLNQVDDIDLKLLGVSDGTT